MTRVTQSMLSSNLLRNLNNSYDKMSKQQNQINTGMKISRPSDDPVIAVKAMRYRTDLDKIGQFQRNMNEAESWLDTTDTSLGQVGDVLNRVKELVVQAANDTNTAEERSKINQEIEQIQQQMMDVANTQVGGKYIFSGTRTQQPLYVGGLINPQITSPGKEGEVKVEVFDGIQLTVNSNDGPAIFTAVNDVLSKISSALKDPTSTGGQIGDLLGSLATGADSTIADLQGKVLDARADVGARQNRVELMMNRLELQEINVTKQKSLNEDVDYAETITQMTTTESIHQAALSVGAKIIQQTLVDFMR